MRRENRKEDAVSPVIGVMLMLVVTVVIAAVVVGFSTGLAGSTGTTPTALFEVSGIDTGRTFVSNNPDSEELLFLNLRHKGGDAIPLSDLKVSLQTVGGGNSGIILVYTASDATSSLDYTNAQFVTGTTNIDAYNSAKKTIEETLPKFLEEVEKEGKDPNDFSEFWKTVDPTKVRNYLKNKGINNYRDGPLREYADTLSNAYHTYMLKTVEELGGESNLVFDKNTGELLGGLAGFTETYPMTVLGQDVPSKSTVSTGNIIHIVPVTGAIDGFIETGTSVKWTISYIPTNSVIAKGEFEVIAD